MFSYILSSTTIASSSSTKRKTSVSQHKGKVPAIDDGVSTTKLLGVEDVLNQTYFFNKHDQTIEYGRCFTPR